MSPYCHPLENSRNSQSVCLMGHISVLNTFLSTLTLNACSCSTGGMYKGVLFYSKKENCLEGYSI